MAKLVARDETTGCLIRRAGEEGGAKAAAGRAIAYIVTRNLWSRGREPGPAPAGKRWAWGCDSEGDVTWPGWSGCGLNPNADGPGVTQVDNAPRELEPR